MEKQVVQNLGGLEVGFAETEEDVQAEAIEGLEASGLCRDGLDVPIGPFMLGAGGSGGNRVEHALRMPLNGHLKQGIRAKAPGRDKAVLHRVAHEHMGRSQPIQR